MPFAAVIGMHPQPAEPALMRVQALIVLHAHDQTVRHDRHADHAVGVCQPFVERHG